VCIQWRTSMRTTTGWQLRSCCRQRAGLRLESTDMRRKQAFPIDYDMVT
jgi:hypothetical protein